MRLDLFSLRLFVDVAEQGSMGRGAAKNCIAVSAASKRIAELERTLGVQLLQRLPRGVATTPAGDMLRAGVNDTLASLQQLAAAVSEEGDGVRTPVRVHANLTSLVHHLPGLLKDFRAEHPSIAVELQEHDTASTLQAVLRGDAEIGIVAPIQPYAADLATFRCEQVQYVLVVPPGHALAGLPSVRIEQAAGYDFIGLESDGGWDQLLRKVAQERGHELRVRWRVNGFDSMCHLVASGLGVAVVPLPLAERHVEALCPVALAEPWAEIPLDVCYRAEAVQSKGVRLLLAHMRARAKPARATGVAHHAPPVRLGTSPAEQIYSQIARGARAMHVWLPDSRPANAELPT